MADFRIWLHFHYGSGRNECPVRCDDGRGQMTGTLTRVAEHGSGIVRSPIMQSPWYTRPQTAVELSAENFHYPCPKPLNHSPLSRSTRTNWIRRQLHTTADQLLVQHTCRCVLDGLPPLKLSLHLRLRPLLVCPRNLPYMHC